MERHFSFYSPPPPHQLQLPPGCHVKNVRHPQQQRRRMQNQRMLHRPSGTTTEFGHQGIRMQNWQHGQQTPFGQLLHQMRQQRQHQEHQQQPGNLRQHPGGLAPHPHRHQQHRMRQSVPPGEVGNHVDESLNSVVPQSPRRPMHRQWIRNHPSKCCQLFCCPSPLLFLSN